MSDLNQFFTRKSSGSGDYWLAVSDLMAALMVIFMFISIAFMMRVMHVVAAWEDGQEKIYEQLVTQFQRDVKKWNAEFDQARLTIRFKDPDTLFKQGEANLQAPFKRVLNEFCPRYFDLVSNFVGDIDEVRIEGHTSPEWNDDTSKNAAFFNNMQLSQQRTRSVMSYCFSLPQVAQHQWIYQLTRAVGMSSSLNKFNEQGEIDLTGSRRVEFRIKTKAEERISEILDSLK